MNKWLQSIKDLFCTKADHQEALNAHLVDIETPRLRLREVSKDDTDTIFKIVSQPGFAYFSFDGTREAVEKFVQKCIDTQKPNGDTGQRDNIMLAVERKEDGALIGFTSLETVRYPEGLVVVEPNFFIDPAEQSKGYGREAVMNIMKYGFDNLKIAGLNCTIEAQNTPSLKVAYKAGYRETDRTVSFDTPQGNRTYKVLVLEKETFYEAMKGDNSRHFLRSGANDNQQASGDCCQRKQGMK